MEYRVVISPKMKAVSDVLTEAFVEAALTGKQPAGIAEEGYYASILCLWGHEAISQGQMLEFPKEYCIDYDVYGTSENKTESV